MSPRKHHSSGGSAAGGRALGGAASSGDAGNAEHAKQVRSLYEKYYRGKQRAALDGLEKLAAEHPSGIVCLALTKLLVLEGFREALKVEPAEQRETVLLTRLHAALRHSMRGVMAHRSVGCAVLTARLTRACRGRGSNALIQERMDTVWNPLSELAEGSDALKGKLLGTAEGWSDPTQEELPVTLRDDRWGLDYSALARQGYTLEKYLVVARKLLAEALEISHIRDSAVLFNFVLVNIHSPQTQSQPVEEGLLEDDHFPENAKRGLRAFLASLEAQRSRANGSARLALEGSCQEAAEDDDKEDRQKARVFGRGDLNRRMHQQRQQAALEKLKHDRELREREKQLRLAKERTEKLQAYLLSRIGAEGSWEALSEAASVPLEEFMEAIQKLEQQQLISPEQASRAQRSAELLASGTSVYYSLPAGLRPSRLVQQGPSGVATPGEPSAGPPSPAGDMLLSYEEAGAALVEAAREKFSWGEQRKSLTEHLPQWDQILRDVEVEPSKLGIQPPDLLLFSEPLPAVEAMVVRAQPGDLAVLTEEPGSSFGLPPVMDRPDELDLERVIENRLARERRRHLGERRKERTQRASSRDSQGSGSSEEGAGAAVDADAQQQQGQVGGQVGSALDRLYYESVTLASRLAGLLLGMPPEPALGRTPLSLLSPQTTVEQAKTLLAQHLLGHCMLRELRAAAQEADTAAASALRLAAAHKAAAKLLLGELAEAAVQDQAAAKHAQACRARLVPQLCQREWEAVRRAAVVCCAPLSLALAGRPADKLSGSGPDAEAALCEIKRAAVLDVLLALQHLQREGRLSVHTMDALHKFVCQRYPGAGPGGGGEVAADTPEGAPADASLPLSSVSISAAAVPNAAASPEQSQLQAEEQEMVSRHRPGQLLHMRLHLAAAADASEARGFDRFQAALGRQCVADLQRMLGALRLPDLMRAHAHACLLLAWHHPTAVDLSPRLAEHAWALEKTAVSCELLDLGTSNSAEGKSFGLAGRQQLLRITPAGLELVARKEQAVELALQAAGAKQALALQRSRSAMLAAPGHVPVLAQPGEKVCAAVAAAACGLSKGAAEQALLAAANGADALADMQEPPESKQKAAYLLAALQRLMTLHALVAGVYETHIAALLVNTGHLHDVMMIAKDSQMEPTQMLTDPKGLCAKLSSAVWRVHKGCQVAAEVGSAVALIRMLSDVASLGGDVARVTALEMRAREMSESQDAARLKVVAEALDSHAKSVQALMSIELMQDRDGPRLQGEVRERVEQLQHQLVDFCKRLQELMVHEQLECIAGRATPAVLLQVPQLLEGGRHLLERVIQGLMAGIGVVGHASLVLQVLEGRLLSAFLGEVCAQSCAADVGEVLLHHVLPLRWETQLQEQQHSVQHGSSGDAVAVQKALTGPPNGDGAAAAAAAAELLEEERRAAEAKQARGEKEQRRKERQRAKARQGSPPTKQRSEAGSSPYWGSEGSLASPSSLPAEPQELKAAPSSATCRATEDARQAEQTARDDKQAAAQEPVVAGHPHVQRGNSLGKVTTQPLAGGLLQANPEGIATKAVESGVAGERQGNQATRPYQASPVQLQQGVRDDPGQSDMQQGGPATPPPASPLANGTPEAELLPRPVASAQRADPSSAAHRTAAPPPPAAVATQSPIAAAVSPRQLRQRTGAAAREAPAEAAAAQHSSAAVPASPARHGRVGSRHSGGGHSSPQGGPHTAGKPGIQAELAAQLRAAQQQGLLGADGEVDVAKLKASEAAGAVTSHARPAGVVLGGGSGPAGSVGELRGQSGSRGFTPKSPAAGGQASGTELQGQTTPTLSAEDAALGRARSGSQSRAAPGPLSIASSAAPGAPRAAADSNSATTGPPQQPQRGGPASLRAAQQGPWREPEVVRFVRWEGDWLCRCGRVNPLRADCQQCGYRAPCRDWFRGKCGRGNTCMAPHPLFDLPAIKPHTNAWGETRDGKPLANPPPNAIYKRPPGGNRPAARVGLTGDPVSRLVPLGRKPSTETSAGASAASAAVAGPASAAATVPNVWKKRLELQEAVAGQQQPQPQPAQQPGPAQQPEQMERGQVWPERGPEAVGLSTARSALEHSPDRANHRNVDLQGSSSATAGQEAPGAARPAAATTLAAEAPAGAWAQPRAWAQPAESATRRGLAEAPAAEAGDLLALGWGSATGQAEETGSGVVDVSGSLQDLLHIPSSSTVSGTLDASAAAALAPHPQLAPPVVVGWAEPAGQRQQHAQQQAAEPSWAARLAVQAQRPAPQSTADQASMHEAGDGEEEDALAVMLQTMGVSSELENTGSWSFGAEPHHPPSSWEQQHQQQQLEEPLAWQQQPQQQQQQQVLSPWHHRGQQEGKWHGAGAGEPGSPMAPADSWPGIGQSQEDADLQAAVQASLADARRHPWQHTYPSDMFPAAQQHIPLGPARVGESPSPELDLAGPGLANAVGEYNCFLNVVIQCLWYCQEFRRQVTAWPEPLYGGNPVLAALRDLFLSFAAEEEAKRQRTLAAAARQAIDPTPLREALAALPQGPRIGEMSDAAEVLDAIYQQIKEASAGQGLPAGVEQLFGLWTREAVDCSKCGKATHQTSYVQCFYNTQATALRMQRLVSEAEGEACPSLGRLLRLIEGQARKTCDTDVGGCGEWNPITHFLDRPPRVFTLQLAWESHREEAGDIAATLAAVDEQVDLGEVYCAHEAAQDVYRLRSLVCYYGAHYQAFVLVPDLDRWLMFDDTRITTVGSWADVCRKCEMGRIQPSVLFYERL